MFIREGSLLFRGELGSFQKTKKILHSKNCEEKIVQGEPWEKIEHVLLLSLF